MYIDPALQSSISFFIYKHAINITIIIVNAFVFCPQSQTYYQTIQNGTHFLEINIFFFPCYGNILTKHVLNFSKGKLLFTFFFFLRKKKKKVEGWATSI